MLPNLFAAAVPLAWLLPSHFPPWLCAWQEGFAIAALALAALTSRGAGTVAMGWLVAMSIALTSIALQSLTGRIAYGGDATMAGLYVVLFGLALAVGAAQTGGASRSDSAGQRSDFLTTFALGTLAAALISTAIAFAQWARATLPLIWMVDIPPGAVPFANLAQPNHFNSAAFLGLCALALLREVRALGGTGFWLGAIFLLAGMVMSGSRTAWVQLAILAAMVAWFGWRRSLTVGLASAALLIALYVVLHQTWSSLDGWMMRGSARPMDEKMLAGARPQVWADMLRAVAQEPWWGHGWQQVTAAQQRVALERPPVPVFFEHFDHSHNLLLDLLVWAGIPAGGTIIILGAVTLARLLRRLDDVRVIWSMVAVLGIGAHAMLEYPLEYAYFLVPIGLLLGAGHALTHPAQGVRMPRAVIISTGLGVAILLAVIGRDYVEAEENFRTLRFEAARIGATGITSKAPDLRVLTHLEAFLDFARTEARPGMSAQEIDRMRHVSERFGIPATLLRYALASGLNGRPDDASRSLARICHIHSKRRCNEAREAWRALQLRYEVLRPIAPP